MPATRPLAPALLLHLCGLRVLRLPVRPNRQLANSHCFLSPLRSYSNARKQSLVGLYATEAGLAWTHGEGPLQRAMASKGFPKFLELDPELSAAGGCVHIPGLGCPRGDCRLAKELFAEIEAAGDVLGMHRSKRHLQVFGEKLMGSATFTAIVARLLMVFDLSLVDCWVNAYRNGGESKSWHHDNYRDRLPRPTVTIGLSLGAPRELLFEHAPSGRQFRVMQYNGDVFAFDQPFNRYFRHSVPPAPRGLDAGLRLSVILWAVEGQGIAIPAMTRGGLGALPQQVRWDNWDLEAGIWSSSRALVPSQDL